ncbi:MAG: serine/threonine protein kinase [Thermodesulfobacteriota bacterium]
MNEQELRDFSALTPDLILGTVERAIGRSMTGLTYPLPSYINRVYELQTRDGERIIAKFYRPGRWSSAAIVDEHRFVMDCAAEEIPVAAPLVLADGSTLAEADGYRLAVFPKKSGREFDIKDDTDWLRIGRLVARMHLVGCRRTADARIRMHPRFSMAADVEYLKTSGAVSSRCLPEFTKITDRMLAAIDDLFTEVETIRIHGDCHRANLLERPGEGLMVIDFDDMVMGPPVQDIWLLLPDHAGYCRREIDLLLEGYEQFRKFDRDTLVLIEPLRAMRIIYYLAWCGRQRQDYHFRHHFPEWGNERFWEHEIADLHRQLQQVEGKGMPAGSGWRREGRRNV